MLLLLYDKLIRMGDCIMDRDIIYKIIMNDGYIFEIKTKDDFIYKLNGIINGQRKFIRLSHKNVAINVDNISRIEFETI